MPRPDRRDEWDDRPSDARPPRRKGSASFGATLLAAAGFGLTLIAGGVIGFAAGRSPREVEKPKVIELADNTPPAVKPPVVPPPTPTPELKPKPEVKKPPEPKKEPPKKQPDPPKKVDPPTPPVNPPAGMVSFQKEVFPIFKAKCSICHGDVKGPKGDLDLRTLAGALKGGDNGAGAKPGKPDDSTIWKSIDDGTMPPAGKEKLTAAEMKTIKDWILAGAK